MVFYVTFYDKESTLKDIACVIFTEVSVASNQVSQGR